MISSSEDATGIDDNGPGRVSRRVALKAVAATLVAGAAAPGIAAADTGAGPQTGPDRPDLQNAVQAVVDAGFAGAQVRVHDRQGDWVGSAGVRKLGEPAKPPTDGHAWVGSCTKTFTATLVLQLVAEGRIGLDAPVAYHLPALGLDPRITTRMLLQHTSGLFNYTGEFSADGTVELGIPATGKEWVDNRFRRYRPEELVGFALSRPARFEPGAGFSYANTNYTMALLLIEAVTGCAYAEELQNRILGPLGLSGTVVPGNRTQLPRPYSHGYYRYQDAGEWKVADVTRQNLSLLAGAGDLISTTQDLQTFITALVGGRLLPASLLEQMRTPNPVLGYGLGLFVQDLGPTCGGTVVLHHNGGPPGGYGALMYGTPDGGTTMTALATAGDAAIDLVTAYPAALQGLLAAVFCRAG